LGHILAPAPAGSCRSHVQVAAARAVSGISVGLVSGTEKVGEGKRRGGSFKRVNDAVGALIYAWQGGIGA
jgi:hypothetical protein